MSQIPRPAGVAVVGILAALFGLGEIVVGFAGNYLGILSKPIAPANATIVVGAFYILGGVSLFVTRRKWGAALSIVFIGAEILGRVYLVMTGIAPSSGPDAVKILIGGAIACALALRAGNCALCCRRPIAEARAAAMHSGFDSSALGAALAGCATAPPPMSWVRVDGQRYAANPVLAEQFEVDRTVCLGERQKAALSGVAVVNGSFAAAVAAQERANSADAVARGCMAEKGYLLVPEDQAEAKRSELAAIAEQKRKDEAAAAAPPPKPRKPAPKPAPAPS